MEKKDIIIVAIAGILIFVIFITIGILWYNGLHKSSNQSNQPNQPNPPGQNQPPTTAPTAKPTINYGDTIQLKNQLNGLLLSSCGGASECPATSNATLRTDTIAPTSQQWQIMSTSNIQSGTPVKYGDKIYLKNLYGNQELLASCGNIGTNCGLNVVVGRNNPDIPSQTWTVQGMTTGTNVSVGDTVQLMNGYTAVVLSACGYFEAGGNCGINVSLRTDNGDPQSKFWTITKIGS